MSTNDSPLEDKIDEVVSPSVIVWGTWTLMLLSSLVYVSRFAYDVPFYDEWSVLKLLGEFQPFDEAWLWEPRNDHRIPLPKLVLFTLYRLSGWDFRVGMYFNVIMLSALAGYLVRVSSQLRGHPAYSDVFFPLVLMHWGHYEYLLWTWQLTQLIPVAIVIWLLAVLVQGGARPNPKQAILSGLAIAALPLCGIPGIAYVPALAVWLLEVGRQYLLQGRRNLFVVSTSWGLSATALVLIPLYFAGLKTSVGTLPGPIIILRTMVAFISKGLGPTAVAFRIPCMLLTAAVFLMTLIVLLRGVRALDATTRSRTWAMLLFFGAFAALALSVGIARPGDTFAPRYFLQAVPAWCWVYFVWSRFTGSRVSRLATNSLAILAIAALGVNSKDGLDYGRARVTGMRALESDLRQGLPPSRLISRHQRAIFPYPEDGGAFHHETLASYFNVLKHHGTGIFVDLADEVPVRGIPLSTVATKQEYTASSEEAASQTWKLDTETFVSGIRLEGDSLQHTGTHPISVYWRRNKQEEFSNDRRFVQNWDTGADQLKFWIYEPLYEVKIIAKDLTNPAELPQMTLLVPEDMNSLGDGQKSSLPDK